MTLWNELVQSDSVLSRLYETAPSLSNIVLSDTLYDIKDHKVQLSLWLSAPFDRQILQWKFQNYNRACANLVFSNVSYCNVFMLAQYSTIDVSMYRDDGEVHFLAYDDECDPTCRVSIVASQISISDVKGYTKK
ncbi:hypothetical protein GCM10007377_16910 [Galliscardovia ingluviei]|uniref:Uncharacterized protein n=1 Tax=Galliscardovia ingluviei TaxID=1769422 RepID=A0A8J3AJE1_9BIFI|nr:hypothetical protein GCM10007377_16910 [Galliscardovia ingluviei]